MSKSGVITFRNNIHPHNTLARIGHLLYCTVSCQSRLCTPTFEMTQSAQIAPTNLYTKCATTKQILNCI